jgi:hypothetical protein
MRPILVPTLIGTLVDMAIGLLLVFSVPGLKSRR